MPQVEERVDKLEQAVQSFITSVGIEFIAGILSKGGKAARYQGSGMVLD